MEKEKTIKIPEVILKLDIPTITITICTYNRAEYLSLCLESILAPIQKYPMIDVLVVDNNSTDTTQQVCNTYKGKGMPITWLLEQKQGLSHARNAAINKAIGYYIAYLDDDGIAHSNYIDRLVDTASGFDYDCFGGMYYAYYEKGKPKWISDDFGTKKKISEKRSIIQKGFLSGGNFICKKEVLQALGGFNASLGMQGKKVGYGEEDDIQHKMRLQGYTIAFDPLLAIDHLVAKAKLSPSWHIKHIYSQHKDIILKYNPYVGFRDVLREYIKITFKYIPRFLLKFVKKKDFYWQNLYITVVGSYVRVWGSYKNKNTFSER